MPFSWETAKKPIIALAPMAGYTDSPYRQIVKKIAPEIICFSELTSSDAIRHESEKTMQMLDFKKGEYPLVMQLFGKKAEFFVEAGKKLEQLGVAAIDINMGCPAKKVLHALAGAALIKDSCLAAEIVYALSQAVKIPVSVKTRLGYDSYDLEKLIKFAKNMEAAGAKLFTLHGRTTKHGFVGIADWEPVYEVKKALKIPVIGNGDITSAEIAEKRLKSPDGKIVLDGIMIGRASFGNPWLLAEIYAKLHNKKYETPKTLKEKNPFIIEHFKAAIKRYGEKIGIFEMRKHLGAYIRGIENAKEVRLELMKSTNPKEILEILKNLK